MEEPNKEYTYRCIIRHIKFYSKDVSRNDIFAVVYDLLALRPHAHDMRNETRTYTAIDVLDAYRQFLYYAGNFPPYWTVEWGDADATRDA